MRETTERSLVRGSGRRHVTGLVTVLLTTLLPLVGIAAPAAAAGECAKWAATSGDDGNAGTQAAPYRSLNKLVNSLANGQTGCLPAGQTYFAVQGNGIIGGGGSGAAPKTITSGGPGGAAVVKGGLWLQGSSHDLRLEGLTFAGAYNPDGTPFSVKGTHLIVHGDRIDITDSDITNPFGICIGVGKGHQTSTEDNVLAEDVRVLRNTIHGCGTSPSITWHNEDSGAHGVYLEHTLDAVVQHNLIYGNRYRGLQLWPRNDGADISYNTFDENATHVNIGSSIACGQVCRLAGGFVSENTDVHHNIMSHRVTDWRPSQNESQLFGFFPAGTAPSQYGNTVHDNCFAPDDVATAGYGYQAYDNTTASVTYVDRPNRDYHLTEGSSCAGKGPSWLQPQGPPPPPVVRLHDASVVEGDGGGLTELHMEVTRTGDLSAATTATVNQEDITATTNGDYNYLPGGKPLFEAGESESVLIFEVLSDDVDEADETFRVWLTDPENGTLADGEAIGTIIDDDGGVFRPDAQARRNKGAPWTGADVYGSEGSQVLRVRLPQGSTRRIQVRVENDGTLEDDWSFAEDGAGAPGVNRWWMARRRDVTQQVDTGNRLYSDVPPGADRRLTLKVRAGRRTEPGTVAVWHLHGVHNPLSDGVRDVVTIRVKVVR